MDNPLHSFFTITVECQPIYAGCHCALVGVDVLESLQVEILIIKIPVQSLILVVFLFRVFL